MHNKTISNALSIVVGLWFSLPLIFVLSRVVGDDLVALILLVPVWLISGPAVVIALLVSRSRQSYVVAALVLAVLVLGVLLRWQVVWALEDAGDLLHFAFEKPAYDRQVVASGSHLKYFDWGGDIWITYGVIYDETDSASLTKHQRPPGWGKRVIELEDYCGAWHLWGHYYLASFGCAPDPF